MIVIQPIAGLIIAALGREMPLILDSILSLAQRATVHYVLLANRGLHYYIKVLQVCHARQILFPSRSSVHAGCVCEIQIVKY